MESKISKSILRAYFAGRATPLQKQLVAEFLREEANRETFYRALHEWEKENAQFLPDVMSDFQRLRAQMEQGRNPEETAGETLETPVVRRPFLSYWLAAASVGLVVLLSWWQRERLLYRTYSTAYGQIQTIYLPDSSRVTLNANSTLKVPRFAVFKDTREVKLAGEAEFSVVHTHDNRRFLVHTPDQLEVEVLGTEFIVYSRNRGSKVVLNRGKVKLRSLKDKRQKPLAIRPGDVVIVTKQGTFNLQRQQAVAEHTAWKEHRFVFNRTPLADIVRQIHEQFGVTVLIPDAELAAHQLSGNYPAQNANDLLEMMTRLLNLRLQHQNDTLVLSRDQ
ncbi:FecR family protein [Larkinella arboricola]|uniref:FecR family protein n=1 Tax=Larkinella arboricola TaxID=643671 RepID=A0A327XAR0_LARAB|nr:FecR domain-containing protein [Larkinella arboricola]RAK03194.1 FecR family protein [Larkinella arboricola]